MSSNAKNNNLKKKPKENNKPQETNNKPMEDNNKPKEGNNKPGKGKLKGNKKKKKEITLKEYRDLVDAGIIVPIEGKEVEKINKNNKEILA